VWNAAFSMKDSPFFEANGSHLWNSFHDIVTQRREKPLFRVLQIL